MCYSRRQEGSRKGLGHGYGSEAWNGRAKRNLERRDEVKNESTDLAGGLRRKLRLSITIIADVNGHSSSIARLWGSDNCERCPQQEDEER